MTQGMTRVIPAPRRAPTSSIQRPLRTRSCTSTITGGKLQSPDSNESVTGGSFLERFNYVLGQPNVPQTITPSAGEDEKDPPLE